MEKQGPKTRLENMENMGSENIQAGLGKYGKGNMGSKGNRREIWGQK